MDKSKPVLKNQIQAVNELRELNRKNKLLYFKDVFDKSEEKLKAEYNINYDLYKQALKEMKKYRQEFVDNFKDFDIDMVYFKTFKKDHPHIFKFLCEDKLVQKYIRKYYFSAVKTNNRDIAEEIKLLFRFDDSIKDDPKYLDSIKSGALSIVDNRTGTASSKNIEALANLLKNFEVDANTAQSLNITKQVKSFLDHHNR